LVRLADVEVTETFKTAKEADAIKQLYAKHYGHAGREFLQSGDLLDSWNIEDAVKLGTANSNEAGRAQKSFWLACHAGQLAARRGILPWSEEQNLDAAQFPFDSWYEFAPGASDTDRGIDNIRDFILKHASRFQEFNEIPRDRVGWKRDGM